MPLISKPSYKAPWAFKSAHLNTIYPALFRHTPFLTTTRERIDTPDGDFIDIDWARSTQSQRTVVISHGLEGSSQGHYVKGMVQTLGNAGWNICAWNFRGCSGEPNLRLQSYHSGATDDLDWVIQHILQKNPTTEISLIGFSLGGNLTLKYIGEQKNSLPSAVRSACCFSVPCDLASSARKLEQPSNRIYMQRFMRLLRPKVREKIQRFPDQLTDHGLQQMQTFAEFDDAYTAPIHGFRDANHYWRESSCTQYLADIQIPTLLINAADDPFLSPSCFPTQEAQKSKHLHLEIPPHGGHVGFVQFNRQNRYWSEQRALEFLKTYANA